MRLTFPSTSPAVRSVMRMALAGAAATTAVAGLLATGASARVSAPANDNYLARAPIVGERLRATINTTQAGEQANLFAPGVAGMTSGAAQPETLSCDGEAYGKTVWFDIPSRTADGGVHIVASGYDAVIAVYEYDPGTGAITRSLGCQDASKGTAEVLDIAPPKVQRGRAYAVQVGGAVVGGVAQSGVLNVGIDFYGDRDGDGVADANDLCPDTPGVRGGCPPQIPGTPRLAVAGMRVVLLEWSGLPHGSEVRARCSRCGGPGGVRQTVRVGRSGTARLTAFAGRRAHAGAVLKVVARARPTGSGAAHSGAIGKSARYRFGSGTYRWDIGCLEPGSLHQRMACPR